MLTLRVKKTLGSGYSTNSACIIYQYNAADRIPSIYLMPGTMGGLLHAFYHLVLYKVANIFISTLQSRKLKFREVK